MNFQEFKQHLLKVAEASVCQSLTHNNMRSVVSRREEIEVVSINAINDYLTLLSSRQYFDTHPAMDVLFALDAEYSKDFDNTWVGRDLMRLVYRFDKSDEATSQKSQEALEKASTIKASWGGFRQPMWEVYPQGSNLMAKLVIQENWCNHYDDGQLSKLRDRLINKNEEHDYERQAAKYKRHSVKMNLDAFRQEFQGCGFLLENLPSVKLHDAPIEDFKRLSDMRNRIHVILKYAKEFGAEDKKYGELVKDIKKVSPNYNGSAYFDKVFEDYLNLQIYSKADIESAFNKNLDKYTKRLNGQSDSDLPSETKTTLINALTQANSRLIALVVKAKRQIDRMNSNDIAKYKEANLGASISL